MYRWIGLHKYTYGKRVVRSWRQQQQRIVNIYVFIINVLSEDHQKL